jgi:hypothetical protein
MTQLSVAARSRGTTGSRAGNEERAMVDRSFQNLNDDSRERLTRLVATLTSTQLEVPIGEGWTVGSALAHVAFWDRWEADHWRRMLSGEHGPDAASIKAVEIPVNDALHPIWTMIKTASAGVVAVEAATCLDALIASAPDSIVDALEGTNGAFLLHRYLHRNKHLDHIERSLSEIDESRNVTDWSAKNAASRRRLAALVGRLSPDDMSVSTEPTDEGSWTIAQSLGHVLFWDMSMETRWRTALARAGEDGPVDIASVPTGLADAINEPLAGLIGSWTQSLGLDIAQKALAAAESLDALIEANAHRLPVGAVGQLPNVLERWRHRDSHLDGLEKALDGRAGATVASRGN